MRPAGLARHARSTTGFLAVCVGLGVAGAITIVAQATLLAGGISSVVDGRRLATGTVVALAVVVAVRAGLAWAQDFAGARAAAVVKAELRQRLFAHLLRLGPSWLSRRPSGEVTTLATHGLDALDGYFARYLPQTILAGLVPVVVLIRVSPADWVAAVTIALTLPLIPIFMALVGWTTRERTERQLTVLTRLSHHFLDVVGGLATLKANNRDQAQIGVIGEVTDAYRRATMRTLRLAFLSSLVLELLATLSVALVAVGIGLRLVGGSMDLRTGLLVLLLAPEAYLPLRRLGTEYHAAAEGMAAAEAVVTILDTAPELTGTEASLQPVTVLTVHDLTVRYPDRDAPAVSGLSLSVRPGETVALTGPSGAGKSTVLNALLGFGPVARGTVSLGGLDLTDADPVAWRRQIAWVPQHPNLVSGTVADNVRVGRPEASDAEIADAATAAGLPAELLGRPVGDDGRGLSAGQRQRVALARAFLRDAPVVLLDEPTANLDPATEAAVLPAVRALLAGRIGIVVAHRPALLPLADRQLELTAPVTPAARVAPAALVAPAAPEPTAASSDASNTAAGPSGRAAAAMRPLDTAAGVSGWGVNGSGGAAAGAATRSVREGDPRWPVLRLLRLARPAWPRLALAVVAGAAAAGAGVGLMATSAWLISRASQHPPVLMLMVAIVSVRGFGLSRGFFRYAERLLSHDAALRVLSELRTRTFARLSRLVPAAAADLRGGDLVAGFVADVDGGLDILVRVLLPFAVCVVVAVASVGLIATVLPVAGVVLGIGVLVAAVGAPALHQVVSRRAEDQVTPLRGRMGAQAVALVDQLPDVVAYEGGALRLAELATTDTALCRTTERAAVATSATAGLTSAAGGFTAIMSLSLGAAAVSTHQLGPVMLAVVVLTPLAVFEVLGGLSTAAAGLRTGRAALARVFALLDRSDPTPDPPVAQVDLAGPFHLVLRGVDAEWTSGATVLSDVDIRLPPGSRTVVVGPSGSGKSTLAALLVRFLDPVRGSVTINGTDLRDLTGAQVRSVVGLVDDRAYLFDTTIAGNLRVGAPTATDERLHDVLDAVHLGQWVSTLPLGLATRVGEHGHQVSGGQRRRLALARALLADRPVLVLDEPTEHLDDETARQLQHDLLDAAGERTVVLITHRPLVDDRVDQVIAIREGTAATTVPAAATRPGLVLTDAAS